MSRAPELDALARDPGAFDAATAIRLAQGEAARTGRPLEIAAPPSNAAALAAIDAFEDGAAIRLTTPVGGLVGPLGPLPPAYTVLAARDRRRGAGGLAAFLDVITTRLALLYADAADKYDIARLLRWTPRGRDRVTNALHALTGLAHPGAEAQRPLPEEQTLRHAGILARRVRSAEGLRAIVSAELGLPVAVRQFELRWRELPAAELSRAGRDARLGAGAAAGAHAPDRAGQVRIRIGPVRHADFLSLGEGQERLARLRALTRFYLPAAMEFDIQVVLDRRDVPRTRLGGDGPAPKLGWNVWARSRAALCDAEDSVLAGRPSHPIPEAP